MPGEPAQAKQNAPGPAAPPGRPAGLAAVDREFQALRVRMAGGVSPIGVSLACLDWREAPPGMGAPARGCPPLDDAPGTHVLQR